MKQTLNLINEILISNGYAAINEATAIQWDILGGESYSEIENMTACYMGEQEQAIVARNYYANSRYL